MKKKGRGKWESVYIAHRTTWNGSIPKEGWNHLSSGGESLQHKGSDQITAQCSSPHENTIGFSPQGSIRLGLTIQA
eukprot:1161497-Pelagomonas_calceolata.AAC.1